MDNQSQSGSPVRRSAASLVKEYANFQTPSTFDGWAQLPRELQVMIVDAVASFCNRREAHETVRSLRADLPLNFHPAASRATAVLNRPQTLDQRKLEFSGLCQGGGLVALPGFISAIGTLLPIAPC
ncbi:hypothetical protein, partial [Rhizobium bangladeshense]|uniref:hypothetical protein n=1 Tax=Rhizobium bangladeshense TaxID=1138189 RepID=UPI001C82E372